MLGIFWYAVLTIGSVLFVSFCIPVALSEKSEPYNILKISLPIGILIFIFLWFEVFYTIKQEDKLKKAIIKKFSLKENEYIEVIVSDFSFFPIESTIIIETIKTINNNANIPTNINNEAVELPCNALNPPTDALIKIFIEHGGKFYLHFDNDYNIFLSLKDSEGNLLSSTEACYNTALSQMLNGSSTPKPRHNTVLNKILNGFSPIS